MSYTLQLTDPHELLYSRYRPFLPSRRHIWARARPAVAESTPQEAAPLKTHNRPLVHCAEIPSTEPTGRCFMPAAEAQAAGASPSTVAPITLVAAPVPECDGTIVCSSAVSAPGIADANIVCADMPASFTVPVPDGPGICRCQFFHLSTARYMLYNCNSCARSLASVCKERAWAGSTALRIRTGTRFCSGTARHLLYRHTPSASQTEPISCRSL
ncbi:hypothetical protein C8Q80DRAFT_430123 [Daedaleopsis nitida]|nr:hypothetical protein C8Q80DRAFT_430123 [Daedaleopsis nitida]